MRQGVLFAYKNELPSANGGNLPGRPDLFAKLRDRSLTPLVTLGAEAAFTDDGVEASTLLGPDEEIMGLGHVALSTVGVLVSRLDRSIKKDKLPRPDLLPAMINENETRSLAFRKIRAHKEVLGPLGLDMPTVLLESDEDLNAFLDEQPASAMVVKPNNGANGKDILFIDRRNAWALLRDKPELTGAHIIQPAYDFTHAFPKDIKPYDIASREAFEGWNVPDQSKELRVYGFHSPERTEVFPVARAFRNGDQWFFVDPQSLPPQLLDGTREAIQKAARVTGARALYGTVDYGFGSLDGSAPDWKAVELNARMPYLVGHDKHAGVANELRDLLADQILATAHAA